MIRQERTNSLVEKKEALENLRDFIKSKKKENPGYKVLNVGGGLNQHGLPIDAVFDLRSLDDVSAIIYQREMCEKTAWDAIADNEYDFVVCTHTLEDLRDPDFVMSQINRVGKSGYIAVPSKYRELQFCRSYEYIGYPHHRWIFTIRDGEFQYMPKHSFVEFLVRTKQIPWVRPTKHPLIYNMLRYYRYRLLRLLGFHPPLFSINEAEEIEAIEISFYWEEKFEHKLLNNDIYLPPYDSIKQAYISFGEGM
jgi:hypothetical protein